MQRDEVGDGTCIAVNQNLVSVPCIRRCLDTLSPAVRTWLRLLYSLACGSSSSLRETTLLCCAGNSVQVVSVWGEEGCQYARRQPDALIMTNNRTYVLSCLVQQLQTQTNPKCQLAPSSEVSKCTASANRFSLMAVYTVAVYWPSGIPPVTGIVMGYDMWWGVSWNTGLAPSHRS